MGSLGAASVIWWGLLEFFNLGKYHEYDVVFVIV